MGYRVGSRWETIVIHKCLCEMGQTMEDCGRTRWMNGGVFGCIDTFVWDHAMLRRAQTTCGSSSRRTHRAQLPLTALLTLYSTTTGFPSSMIKRPAPTNTPVSRSFNFSSPVSNFISMTRMKVNLETHWERVGADNTSGRRWENRRSG